MDYFLDAGIVRSSGEKAGRCRIVFCALAGAGLALFIILCLCTGTGNARTMFTVSLACLGPLGLGMIAFWVLRWEPAQAEARHLRGLAEGTPEIREGRLSAGADSFRIPRSVRVRKMSLETEKETLSLNLNEKLLGRMPPDGSLVRVQTVRKFITGLEVLEEGAGGQLRQGPSRWKAFRRAAARIFPAAVLWAMLLPMVSGFVFTRITDTDPAHKIVVYADCAVENGGELAERLEKGMDGAVRMAQVRPFSYALFGTEQLKGADLFIVPDGEQAEYAEWFAPEEPVTLYDPGEGTAACGAYFTYTPEGAEPQAYRIYFGARSAHLEDGLARKAAELLLSMDTEKEEIP